MFWVFDMGSGVVEIVENAMVGPGMKIGADHEISVAVVAAEYLLFKCLGSVCGGCERIAIEVPQVSP